MPKLQGEVSRELFPRRSSGMEKNFGCCALGGFLPFKVNLFECVAPKAVQLLCLQIKLLSRSSLGNADMCPQLYSIKKKKKSTRYFMIPSGEIKSPEL